MGPIQLTPSQREVLLDMVKELFPEYINHRFGKNWDQNEIWMTVVNAKAHQNDTVSIHWYELCMTELAVRIHKSVDEPHTMLMFKGYVADSVHPVEYLFHKFLRISRKKEMIGYYNVHHEKYTIEDKYIFRSTTVKAKSAQEAMDKLNNYVKKMGDGDAKPCNSIQDVHPLIALT